MVPFVARIIVVSALATNTPLNASWSELCEGYRKLHLRNDLPVIRTYTILAILVEFWSTTSFCRPFVGDSDPDDKEHRLVSDTNKGVCSATPFLLALAVTMHSTSCELPMVNDCMLCGSQSIKSSSTVFLTGKILTQNHSRAARHPTNSIMSIFWFPYRLVISDNN